MPEITVPTPSIEEQACELLSPRLAACIRQRTQLGIRKYGQRLDHNPQPLRARAVHLVQELLDGIQYALWLGETQTASRLAVEAILLSKKYALTVSEIMNGGKA